MYRNLLVPYDDSEFSRAALLEAAHWARRHQGKLTILHAVFFDTEEFGIAPEIAREALAQGQEFCSAAKARLETELGIEAQVLYREGDPPAEVLAAAEGTGADLIVMGTHGRRGLSRLLMGSVTSHVILRVECRRARREEALFDLPGRLHLDPGALRRLGAEPALAGARLRAGEAGLRRP